MVHRHYCSVHTKSAAEKLLTADYIRSSVAEALHEMCLDAEVAPSQRKFERRKKSRSAKRVRRARLFAFGGWGGGGGGRSPYERQLVVSFFCLLVCVWPFTWHEVPGLRCQYIPHGLNFELPSVVLYFYCTMPLHEASDRYVCCLLARSFRRSWVVGGCDGCFAAWSFDVASIFHPSQESL